MPATCTVQLLSSLFISANLISVIIVVLLLLIDGLLPLTPSSLIGSVTGHCDVIHGFIPTVMLGADGTGLTCMGIHWFIIHGFHDGKNCGPQNGNVDTSIPFIQLFGGTSFSLTLGGDGSFLLFDEAKKRGFSAVPFLDELLFCHQCQLLFNFACPVRKTKLMLRVLCQGLYLCILNRHVRIYHFFDHFIRGSSINARFYFTVCLMLVF